MPLEPRSLDRVAVDFAPDDQEMVLGLLSLYAGPEKDRVVWDILELSNGDVAQVIKYVGAANTDYRDVLYWAEYHAGDPMVQGKEAKEIVNEILEKFGPDAE
jgi:hypothetical protein